MANRARPFPYLSASCHEVPDHRFQLDRRWGPGPKGVFIMLNPSTADGVQDDPTIRKCRGFGQRWGWGGMTVLNLFSYRATHPRSLWVAYNHGGVNVDEGDRIIESVLAERTGSDIVVAWGNLPKRAHPRAAWVLDKIEALGRAPQCLGQTGIGDPFHPLMRGYDNPRLLFLKEYTR